MMSKCIEHPIFVHEKGMVPVSEVDNLEYMSHSTRPVRFGLFFVEKSMETDYLFE